MHGSHYQAFFIDIDSNLVRSTSFTFDFIENIIFNEDEIWVVETENIRIHDINNFRRTDDLERVKTSSDNSHLLDDTFYYIHENFLYYFDANFTGVTDSLLLENSNGIYEFHENSLYYSTTNNDLILLSLDNFTQLKTPINNPISYINIEENNIGILTNNGTEIEGWQSNISFPLDFKKIEIEEQVKMEGPISAISFLDENIIVMINGNLYSSLNNNIIKVSDLLSFSRMNDYTINHIFGIIYTFNQTTIEYMDINDNNIQSFEYDLDMGIDLRRLFEIR